MNTKHTHTSHHTHHTVKQTKGELLINSGSKTVVLRTGKDENYRNELICYFHEQGQPAHEQVMAPPGDLALLAHRALSYLEAYLPIEGDDAKDLEHEILSFFQSVDW